MPTQRRKKNQSWLDSESAQAAIIYIYVVGMAMAIALYIYTGPVVDEFTAFHVSYTQGADPMYMLSQNLEDSIFITQWAYHDWIIIFFIVWTLAAYAAALRYRSGGV
jgi:hypothetical protein